MPTFSDLISPLYLNEQRILHADPRGYGGKGVKWAKSITTVLQMLPSKATILDYGCGQASLARGLVQGGIKVTNYDPAISEYAEVPQGQFDLVVCTDVLEHIEPEFLDNVLDHLQSLTRHYLFGVISTVETAKLLSDGRQAHINLHDRYWWLGKMTERFVIERVFVEVKPDKQVVGLWKRRR